MTGSFITATTTGTQEVQLRLPRISDAVRRALRPEVVSLTQLLTNLIREKLSGQVLNRRSGRLYNSVRGELVESPTRIGGEVATRGVPYGPIHEFGGIIKHPGSSKYQSWIGGDGNRVHTHFTRPHDIPIPERSYMRSSLAERTAEIIERLTRAAKTAAKEF